MHGAFRMWIWVEKRRLARVEPQRRPAFRDRVEKEREEETEEDGKKHERGVWPRNPSTLRRAWDRAAWRSLVTLPRRVLVKRWG